MLAHLVQTGFGGFYDGLAHWALSPRDLMVVLAVALLAGLSGEAAARRAVILLPVSWLIGGLIGFHLDGLGEMLLATTLTMGAGGFLVAINRILPATAFAGFAIILGAVHGLANGSVMLEEGRERLALLGVVTAVAFVTLIASATVHALTQPTARIIVRVAGSWIAAAALLMLGWQLRSP